MKANYRSLKFRLLMQVFINIIIAVLCCYLFMVLVLVVFRDWILAFIEFFGMFVIGLTRDDMQVWYDQLFRSNGNAIFICVFIVIVLFFLYRAFAKVTAYLNQIDKAMEIVTSQDTRWVILPKELAPIEQKLNLAKQAIAQRENQVKMSEQRKSDLVVYLAHDLKPHSPR